MMQWLPYVSYFFGGAFLVNAVPHFVSGLMGRAFPVSLSPSRRARARLLRPPSTCFGALPISSSAGS